MTMFSDKPGKPAQHNGILISPPPNLCTRQSCESESYIQFLAVTDSQGSPRIGLIREFGFVQNGEYYIHANFTFQRWAGRCAFCYTDDLAKARKNQLKQKDETDADGY